MEYTEHFDPERDLLIVEVRGRLSLEGILAMAPRFLAERAPLERLRILADYREAEVGELRGEDLAVLADQDQRIWGEVGDLRCAVVADQDVVYGLARVHQAYAREGPFELRVFRDREEALRWLLPEGDGAARVG